MSESRRQAHPRMTLEEKQRLNTELLPERDNVQVYKDTFDLLVFVYRTTNGMNREYRYTLAEEMKRVLQNLLAVIYEAKKTSPRAALLAEALHWVYEAKVLYRTMDELRLLKDWYCVTYIHLLATISKQLTAWHRYEKRKEEKEIRDAPSGGTGGIPGVTPPG